MSSGDQSVLIISQLCHKCHQNIDELTDNQSCSHCNTPFAENGTPIKTSPALTSLGQTSAEISSEEEIPEADKSTALCSVCLDGLDGQMSELVLNCGHRFHTECLNQMFESIGLLSCPICRRKILDEDKRVVWDYDMDKRLALYRISKK